jgi:hypothetical protein
MKKNILNRPMFKQVKSPAYGTGISANLVSKEERQRYNYGGRVGLWNGSNTNSLSRGYAVPPWFDESIYQHGAVAGVPDSVAILSESDPTRMKDWYTNFQITEDEEGFPQKVPGDTYEKIYGFESPHGTGAELVYDRPYPKKRTKTDNTYWHRDQEGNLTERTIIPEREPDVDVVKKAKELGFDNVESYQAALESGEFGQDVDQGPSKFTIKRLQKEMDAKDAAQTGDITKQVAKQMDTENLDTFNIEDIVKKYYDPKKTLGEAQLGLAGQVLKAGFQKKSDAMATLGDAVGKFGTTVAADEKAMKKLAASGEISKEVYEASQREKGKWAIKLAKEKERLLQERPDKEMTLKEEFDFFKTKTGDYHQAVDMIFGDDIIKIGKDVDINTMKKVPGKIYKIKIGPNLVYRMYDDNGQEIPDFDIEEYIEQVS